METGKRERAEKQQAMKRRVMKFARNVVIACRQAAPSIDGRHVAGQLIRSSTSVAANYRAACRGRSRKEFAAKLGVVVEEADESLFWLDFAREINVLPAAQLDLLADEANQLVAIFSATRTRTIQNSLKSLNP